MKSEIRTAVFPVAGRGTRFLPATKASPKEMLPVVDKPLIQYAVEEALAAGAERLVFITGAAKRAIEDHFDSDPELEKLLEAQGKSDLVRQMRGVLPSYATCIYIRQPAPLGLGHAVLCAEAAVGREPFFVHLADDLIDAEVPCLKQMAATYNFHRGSVLGVEEVPVAGREAREQRDLDVLERVYAHVLKLRTLVWVLETGIAKKRVLSHDRIIGISPATGRTRHGHRFGIGSISQGFPRMHGVEELCPDYGAADGVGFHWSSRAHDVLCGSRQHCFGTDSSRPTHSVSRARTLAGNRLQ